MSNSDLVGNILRVLAVYRLSRLLAFERGPYNLIGKFRDITNIPDCPLCLSVWFAGIITWFAPDWLIILFGLSGGASVIYVITELYQDEGDNTHNGQTS